MTDRPDWYTVARTADGIGVTVDPGYLLARIEAAAPELYRRVRAEVRADATTLELGAALDLLDTAGDVEHLDENDPPDG